MVSIDVSLLSRVENQIKVLLIKRNQEPFKGCWSLMGGKVYNNESCESAVSRELKEKLKIKNVTPFLSGVFSSPNRDPRFRNISVSFFAICEGIPELSINEEKLSDVRFFSIDEVPQLAFDHNQILDCSVNLLREKIYNPSVIKKFFPDTFTLTELQEFFESVFLSKFDKRNFRRKIISLDFLKKTGEKNTYDTHRKSELFRIKD